MFIYNLTCFGFTAIFRENINIYIYIYNGLEKLPTISILKLSVKMAVNPKNVGSEVNISSTV
jgi:hypothetical protein